MRWGRVSRSVGPVGLVVSPGYCGAGVGPLGLVAPLPPARLLVRVGQVGLAVGSAPSLRNVFAASGDATDPMSPMCYMRVALRSGGANLEVPSVRLLPGHRKTSCTNPSFHLLEAPSPATADPGGLTGVEPVDDKVLVGCVLDGTAGLDTHRCKFWQRSRGHPWFSRMSAQGARA